MSGNLKYRQNVMNPAKSIVKKPPPVGSKRSLKRKRLIELASIQMNRWGTASVDLAKIGAEMGISRNTVYYYFEDKHALTSACYEEAVRHAESALDAALEQGGAYFDKLSAFVGYVLNEQAYSIAVMSDLELTSSNVSQKLRSRQVQVLGGVQELVESGIGAGEFRELSPALVARVLLSMLEWKRLWSAFMGHGPEALNENAQEITRWISRGVIIDPAYYLNSAPRLDDVLHTSVDVMNPGSISEGKRNHLIGAASALFNRRGIDATTMEDIARALNSTTGFMYHYVQDKEHLVRLCYDRAFEVYERIWEAGQLCGSGTANSLMSSLHLNAQAQLSDCPPIIIQSELANLPSAYRERSSLIWNKYAGDVRHAIKNKVAYPGSEKMVDVSAGAFFWLGRSEQSKFDLANAPNQIVDLIAHGLCP